MVFKLTVVVVVCPCCVGGPGIPPAHQEDAQVEDLIEQIDCAFNVLFDPFLFKDHGAMWALILFRKKKRKSRISFFVEYVKLEYDSL